MNLNPIRAWWMEAKLYVIGALLIAVAIGYWYHGHEQFKAGRAAGDQEVATLKGQYAQAYDDALRQAQDAQRQADADALAAKQAQLDAARQEIADIAAKKHAAEQSAAAFQKRLNEARKHDATVDSWLRTRVPDGVRAAGEGGPG